MKKQLTVILLSAAVIFSALLSACGMDNMDQSLIPNENTPNTSPSTDYSAAIRQLEDRIVELQQAQYISDAEYQKELAALMQELTLLKNQAEADKENTVPTDPDDGAQQEPDTQPPSDSLSVFLYTLQDNKATITGYTGNDAYLVIPSSIDGYAVEAIAENAFSSDQLRSVIVTNGISKIEWFAFEKCPNLISVTLPASVVSIGYSAFCPISADFTIYCHSGSYAQTYAKSYGLHYAIV